jgi:hypothetical protein
MDEMAQVTERAGLPVNVAECQERGGGELEAGRWRRRGETSTQKRKCDRISTSRRTITLFETPLISEPHYPEILISLP